MRLRVFQVVAFLLSTIAGAEVTNKAPQKLWPAGAPGAAAVTGPEKDTTTAKDNMPAGRPVMRLTNVAEPTITYFAPNEIAPATEAAVLVFPGGGYRILAYDLEGTEICQWLNSIGVAAFLVKYRVPEAPGVPRYQAPLEDAQRAVSWVRSHAAEYSVSPGKIGVLGFSAGGHLLAVLGKARDSRSYRAVDSVDATPCHPDFSLLIYPAYLSVEDRGETVAPEVAPDGQVPATFIVQAEDDRSFIGGTLLYYRALQQNRVAAELHVYSRGGHGYGMRHTEDPVTDWPQLAAGWIHRVLPASGTGNQKQ